MIVGLGESWHRIANKFGIHSDHGDLFSIQMPGTLAVQYSDHHLVNKKEVRPPFEYRSAVQMPATMAPGI